MPSGQVQAGTASRQPEMGLESTPARGAYAKNNIVGRIIPLLEPGFWDGMPFGYLAIWPFGYLATMARADAMPFHYRFSAIISI